jgi:hypothetical protein
MTDQLDLTDPDPLTDSSRGQGRPVPADLPLCAACGRVLPPQGRSRPRKYCPDGQGRYLDQGIECRELGPAQEVVRRVHGSGDVPDLDLDRLGEQVNAVLAVFAGKGPVEGLRSRLGAVAEQLEHTVAAATEARAAAQDGERRALAEAGADQRRRADAQEQARQAVLDAHAAQDERDQAVGERRAAEAALREAERAQAAAEAARDEQGARAERADAAAARDRRRAEDAATLGATLAERVEALQEQVRQTARQSGAERERADAATAAAEQVRAQAVADVRQVTDQAASQVDAVRTHAADAAARHTTAILELERRRGTELAERDQRLREAEAAGAELRRTAGTGLRRLLRSAAPTDSGAAAQDVGAGTPEHPLLRALADLIDDLDLGDDVRQER